MTIVNKMQTHENKMHHINKIQFDVILVEYRNYTECLQYLYTTWVNTFFLFKEWYEWLEIEYFQLYNIVLVNKIKASPHPRTFETTNSWTLPKVKVVD